MRAAGPRSSVRRLLAAAVAAALLSGSNTALSAEATPSGTGDCTITGTDGDDVIRGTPGPDVIAT